MYRVTPKRLKCNTILWSLKDRVGGKQLYSHILTLTTQAPQNCHIFLKTTYTYPFEIALTILFTDSTIPELLLPQVNILLDNTKPCVYVFELNREQDRCPTLDSFFLFYYFLSPKWYRGQRENAKETQMTGLFSITTDFLALEKTIFAR